jgi:hypothetical protein
MGFGQIYNTTWWGNAIETASSIGTKPEFFSGQIKMNERQQVEAVKCLADWTHITALQDLNN